MDPLIGASLINAGTGGLNSLFNIGGARRQNRRMIEFWKMQNAYNHPSQQMARLKEAGLNPRLIYGAKPPGATGNAEQLKPAPRAQHEFKSPLTDITAFQDVKLRTAQTDNVNTQNTLNIQKAALTASQTAGQILRNRSSKVAANVAEQLQTVSVDAAKEALRQQETKTIGLELDNRFKDQTIKNRVMDIMYRAQNSAATLHGNQLLNELRRYEIQLKDLGIERGDNMFFRILGRLFNEELQGFKDYKNKTKF